MRNAFWLATSVWVMTSSTVAYAQKRPKPPAPAVASTIAPEILANLNSGEPTQIASGLTAVTALGPKGGAAAPTIVELLQKGLTVELTEAALQTLAATHAEMSANELAMYTRHRAPRIRLSAIRALIQLGGPHAVSALRRALSDPHPDVRKQAALGLGTLHAKEATGDLFTALDRSILDAAISLGAVCSSAECERLANYVGKIPFAIVTRGLKEALLRPASEVRDATKIHIITKVRELQTPEAAQFLGDVESSWPKDGSRAVKFELDDALRSLGGEP